MLIIIFSVTNETSLYNLRLIFCEGFQFIHKPTWFPIFIFHETRLTYIFFSSVFYFFHFHLPLLFPHQPVRTNLFNTCTNYRRWFWSTLSFVHSFMNVMKVLFLLLSVKTYNMTGLSWENHRLLFTIKSKSHFGQIIKIYIWKAWKLP